MNKKTINTTIFTLGAGLAGTTVQANVIYVDVDPNQYLYNTTYDLDVNGDSLVDFQLSQSYSYSSTSSSSVLSITSASGNGATASSPVIAGTLIDGSLTYESSGTLATYSTSSSLYCDKYGCYTGPTSYSYSGAWSGIYNDYMGLSFSAGGQQYYGWLDLDVNSNATAYVKGFAYESVSNIGIEAGATSSPVPETDTLALLSAGAVPLLALRRRHRRQKAASAAA